MLDARVVARVFATCALAASLGCTADRQPTGIDMPARLALSKAEGDVQFGTASDDAAYAIVMGKLGTAVAGTTVGALGGSNAGGRDAYVRLFDDRGSLSWTHQFGTFDDDGAFGVAMDRNGVYVAGTTSGSLGPVNLGAADGFVSMLDPSGNVVWTTRLASAGEDSAFGVAVDHDALYVTGELRGGFSGPLSEKTDGYIIKLDARTGEILWLTYFRSGGDGHESARGVTVDGSDVYVAATYGGLLGEEDAALVKLDGNTGQILWFSRIVSPVKDVGWDVTTDGGSAYFVGTSNGHAFAAAFSGLTGAMEWKTNLVTAATEIATTTDIDKGTLHVGGFTYGAFPAMSNAGAADAFHVKLDATTGAILAADQFGTAGLDLPFGSFLDGKMWHVVGTTGGSLAGSSAGGLDAWWMQRAAR